MEYVEIESFYRITALRGSTTNGRLVESAPDICAGHHQEWRLDGVEDVFLSNK